MATDFIAKQRSIARKLAAKGAPVQLENEAGKAMGTVGGLLVSSKAEPMPDPAASSGLQVQESTKELLIAAPSIEPQIGWTATFAKVVYRVVAVEATSPAGVPLLYKLRVVA